MNPNQPAPTSSATSSNPRPLKKIRGEGIQTANVPIETEYSEEEALLRQRRLFWMYLRCLDSQSQEKDVADESSEESGGDEIRDGGGEEEEEEFLKKRRFLWMVMRVKDEERMKELERRMIRKAEKEEVKRRREEKKREEEEREAKEGLILGQTFAGQLELLIRSIERDLDVSAPVDVAPISGQVKGREMFLYHRGQPPPPLPDDLSNIATFAIDRYKTVLPCIPTKLCAAGLPLPKFDKDIDFGPEMLFYDLNKVDAVWRWLRMKMKMRDCPLCIFYMNNVRIDKVEAFGFLCERHKGRGSHRDDIRNWAVNFTQPDTACPSCFLPLHFCSPVCSLGEHPFGKYLLRALANSPQTSDEWKLFNKHLRLEKSTFLEWLGEPVAGPGRIYKASNCMVALLVVVFNWSKTDERLMIQWKPTQVSISEPQFEPELFG
ncbi:hypothetical protein ABW19_dt0203423 [Dactylella cylindrospora]|nr:hypothetical protein ABW19_dt0203423 [Dactylella cylindrospora]